MSTTKTAKSITPANGLNQLFTDSYGNQRMAVTIQWCDLVIATGNDFAVQMGEMGKKLGYLSPAQFAAANKLI